MRGTLIKSGKILHKKRNAKFLLEFLHILRFVLKFRHVGLDLQNLNESVNYRTLSDT